MADTAEIAQFEELAKNVKPDDMREKVLVSSDLDMYVTRIHEIATLGVQSIILHNVNRQQGLFIETFGKHVLPAVTSSMRVTADGS
jgi:hypothetical protein